jgi:hypothetical protein
MPQDGFGRKQTTFGRLTIHLEDANDTQRIELYYRQGIAVIK